jgi:hypothetical protein
LAVRELKGFGETVDHAMQFRTKGRFVTTALEAPPANWYPDPSGRAQARYWDGRMWTAHVVRDGAATLDPLDGVQQPREPAPFNHGVTPSVPGPTVGHGTQALQEMAAARPTPPPPSSPERTAEPRISTLGAIGVLVGAILLFGVGIYLFRQGVFTVTPPPEKVSRTVTLEQPDYRVTVPNEWAERTASGSLFDAVYSVPDREILNVAVVDFADPSLSDPAARDDHLALAGAMVADEIGDNPVLVDRTIVKSGDKTLRVVTYDLTDASGIVTRVREYLAVGLDRAVIVTAYGTPGAVDRHLADVTAAARSAKLKSS